MKLYSTLSDKITAKMANETGLETTDNPKSKDTISIIVRKTKEGGVSDPTDLILHPGNCIVIAGSTDETGLAFSEKAEHLGVAAERIYLLPANQGLSIKKLTSIVIKLRNELEANQPAEYEIVFLEDEEEIHTSQESKVKVIAVMGFRGGVGSTTVATSLAALLHDNGGKIAILDLGIPSNIKNHCKLDEFEKRNSFNIAVCEYWDLYQPYGPVWEVDPEEIAALASILRNKYRWIVVDLPPLPDNNHLSAIQPDKTVVVMDSDIIQAVEPAAKVKNALFVYNKTIPDIGLDVVMDVLGQTAITIKTDYEGCYAAMAASKPANSSSEDIAAAMGKLAVKIQ